MVPPDSGRVSRVRPYSGTSSEGSSPFAYGAVTRFGAAFQKLRLDATFLTPAGVQAPGRGPTTPRAQRSGLTCTRFRLCPVRSPLLRTSMALSLPGDTKMFQFSPLASADYEFIVRIVRYSFARRSRIRRSPDQRLLAPPRGLSQLTTSFIASQRQSIHHTPLKA